MPTAALQLATDAPPGPRTRPIFDRRDWMLAVGLLFSLGALYLAFQQTKYWSDGPELLLRAQFGTWTYSKPLYLPLFHAVDAVRRAFGLDDAEQSLLWLSHFATSVAIAALYVASRELGCTRVVALTAALLVGFSPGVFFHATTIEVHSVQLAAASLTAVWMVRAHRRGRLASAAFGWAVALAVLGLAHPTGWFWAPAIVVLMTVHRRAPLRLRSVVAALVVLAAAALVLWAAIPHTPLAGRTATPTLARPRVWLGVTFESASSLAVLLIPAGFGAWTANRVLAASERARLRAAIVALAATFTLLILKIAVFERGAYLFSLLPLIGLAAAFGMQHSRRLLLGCALLLPAQLAVAELSRSGWEHRESPTWVRELDRELGRGVLVLCATPAEQRVVRHRSTSLAHTLTPELQRLAPRELVAVLRSDAPAPRGGRRARLVGGLHALVHAGHSGAMRLALTPSLDDAATPSQRRWLDALESLLGPPAARGDGSCAVYPLPPAP